MKYIKTHKIPNTSLLFVFLAPLTILYYASFIFNPAHAGNIFLYALQITADAIAVLTVGSLWVTIILDITQPEHNRREIIHSPDFLHNKIDIDVLIPVAREDINLIKETITHARDMEYEHDTWVLDDGSSEEVKRLASSLGVKYLSRPIEEKSHAKSGNINYALKISKADFFAVFDADHVPKKTFLKELLPFFENEKVGLVQTPQHYTNTNNFIASGTAQAQEVFYKYVQPAKNSYNASFCVGTNMIYRRRAIDEIGGIARRDHSEDIWTTILLHEKGWESVYYNKILAEGKAPDNIPSYFRQQNRWARGGFTLFFQKNPLFIQSLNVDQRLQYFFSNIHYFSGFAILIYLSLPLIYLYTGYFPMNLTYGREWLIHYLPYAICVYLLPLYLLGSIKLSTISTSMASFAPYIQAFLSTVVKNQYKWVATESKQKTFSPIMYYIWPHVLYLSLAIGSIFVGWYNPSDITTTAIVTAWTMFNIYIMYIFLKNGLTTQYEK